MIKSSLAFKSSSVLLDGCFWRSKWAISYHIHDCGGKMKSTCTLWVMADILWFVACTCSFLPSGVQNLCPRTAGLAVTFICFFVCSPRMYTCLRLQKLFVETEKCSPLQPGDYTRRQTIAVLCGVWFTWNKETLG